jgi:hypothetical protein
MARKAASKWLSDFKEHGTLDIHSIRVSEGGDAFIATVVYSEMAIEDTPPRRFPDQMPLVQSAA